MWVNKYLYKLHGEAQANGIIEDIDCQFVLSIPFISLILMCKLHVFQNLSHPFIPRITAISRWA
jgi:hypothetical protein